MKRYLLAYNARSNSVPEEKHLTAFVKANRYISQWSYLFPGAFFFKSNAELDDIDSTLDDFFRPTKYVLAEIAAGGDRTEGILTEQIWDWLKANEEPIAQIEKKKSDD